MYQMQRGPLFDQRMKAQRYLGAFALRVAPHAQALGAWIDSFGHITETSPGCCSGLPDRDAPPEACNYVLVDGVMFNTGDDCIAIKSGKNTDTEFGPARNHVIR
jgi:hypothetical protein